MKVVLDIENRSGSFDPTAFRYQSFPGDPGMVDSELKLRAIKLPKLAGLAFLDVGCNEGFYCDQALHNGARRVVGVDLNQHAISNARMRFPGIEFLRQSWFDLPRERFDVVLFASCLHYLQDKNEIDRLLKQFASILHKHGTLIIETGLAMEDVEGFEEIQRKDGAIVRYPNEKLLIQSFEENGFVWRNIGDSIEADGRIRKVFHLQLRKKSALIIQGEPGSGKSNLALNLTGLEHVSLDNVMDALFNSFTYLQEIKQRKVQLSESVLLGIVKVNPTTVLNKFTEIVFSRVAQLQSDEIVVIEGHIPEFMLQHLEIKLDLRGYRVWKVAHRHGVIRNGISDGAAYFDGCLTWQRGEDFEDTKLEKIESGPQSTTLYIDRVPKNLVPRQLSLVYSVEVLEGEDQIIRKANSKKIFYIESQNQLCVEFDISDLSRAKILSCGLVDQHSVYRGIQVNTNLVS